MVLKSRPRLTIIVSIRGILLYAPITELANIKRKDREMDENERDLTEERSYAIVPDEDFRKKGLLDELDEIPVAQEDKPKDPEVFSTYDHETNIDDWKILSYYENHEMSIRTDAMQIPPTHTRQTLIRVIVRTKSDVSVTMKEVKAGLTEMINAKTGQKEWRLSGSSV